VRPMAEAEYRVSLGSKPVDRTPTLCASRVAGSTCRKRKTKQRNEGACKRARRGFVLTDPSSNSASLTHSTRRPSADALLTLS